MEDEISARVRAFMNRRMYSRFDLATLASISDHDIELAIQDYVYLRIGNKFEEEERVLSELSPGFRAIHCTLQVEAEVRNGGFDQYFSNSEGRLALTAEEGFQRIGAPEYADLMHRAIQLWQDNRETDTFEAFSESDEDSAFEELDDEFYALVKVSDLSQLRVKYIRTHPVEFITS